VSSFDLKDHPAYMNNIGIPLIRLTLIDEELNNDQSLIALAKQILLRRGRYDHAPVLQEFFFFLENPICPFVFFCISKSNLPQPQTS